MLNLDVRVGKKKKYEDKGKMQNVGGVPKARSAQTRRRQEQNEDGEDVRDESEG